MQKNLMNGFLLDLKCTEILTKVNSKVLLNKTSPDYQSLRTDLRTCIKNFEIITINEYEVADLYINRHLNFMNGILIYDQSGIPKVKGDKFGSCKFPNCNFDGKLEKDHILPKSSYSKLLGKWFDADNNSLLLCKIHNQVVKRDSIGIGLVLRKFLK
jgi:hypothetical protein